MIFTFSIGSLIMQIQLSVHLALGGVGLCLRPAKVGPTTCICSGGPGERSSFILLGKSEAGNTSFLKMLIIWNEVCTAQGLPQLRSCTVVLLMDNCFIFHEHMHTSIYIYTYYNQACSKCRCPCFKKMWLVLP